MRGDCASLLMRFLPMVSIVMLQILQRTEQLNLKMCQDIDLFQDSSSLNASGLQDYLVKVVNGCEYVFGNVIVRELGGRYSSSPNADDIRSMGTSFLDSIVEITGVLTLRDVNLRAVRFGNLRTIRGRDYFSPKISNAMFIINSPDLMELQLPKLSVIEQGSVVMTGRLHASLYCSLTHLVNWTDLFANPRSQLVMDAVTVLNTHKLNTSNACAGAVAPTCDPSCKVGCWSASSANGCQVSTRCKSRRCSSSRCFHVDGSGEEECCDANCLGSCGNQSSTGCYSCREVNRNGSCETSCNEDPYEPSTKTGKSMANPLVRLGNLCVKSCHEPFVEIVAQRSCMSRCPDNYFPHYGRCEQCPTDGTNVTCRTCNFTAGNLSATDELSTRKVGCATWHVWPRFNDGELKISGRANNLSVLRQLQYLDGDLEISDVSTFGVEDLSNLIYVSGKIELKNLWTRYINLRSLQFVNHVILYNVTGLCRKWLPMREEELRKRVHWKEGFTAPMDEGSGDCENAKCHETCKTEEGCWGPGPTHCVSCRSHRHEGRCFRTCAEFGFSVNDNDSSCQPCHPQCRGCRGPANTDCISCRQYREGSACVAACSWGLRPSLWRRCFSVPWTVGGCVVGVVLLSLLLGLALAAWHYRRRIRKYEMVDLDEYLLDSSNPDGMAKLLIVNDDDIVKQKVIGSGAFGTVYRGVLRRESRELPVAVKVLRGRSPKLGQELLNEASVLARVRHRCCIRLVALCVTQELQLVTALMPRGCLLNFVRAKRNRIAADRMLRWSLQVAEGMAYLQSKGIVHRDLAARNVLLQSPDQVRITDFGLARLLDLSEREFANTDGLLPVKWLGLESIESGVFSHQSDVWSFGVLLWEICTFGESPYARFGLRSVDDMLALLHRGIRLNQPDICNLDFYNLMLSCWLPLPDSRPTFQDLVTSLEDCLKEPASFIASGGVGAAAEDLSSDDDAADDVATQPATARARHRRRQTEPAQGQLELDESDEQQALQPLPREPPTGRQEVEDAEYLMPVSAAGASELEALHKGVRNSESPVAEFC